MRSETQLPGAERAARHAGLPYECLTSEMKSAYGVVPVGPMQLTKGLEFRAVAVMACDQEALPDPERIATAADATELKEEVNQRAKPFLPDDHFTVDGTLIQAWASQKSFRAKAGSGDGDGSNFHGQKRSNQTQESTTDPDARLYKKSYGKESHLASLGLPERGVRPQGELRSKTVGRPKPGRSKPVKGTSTLNKTALLDENQPRQHNNAHEKQASQQKFKKVLKMANWLGKATPMRLRSISHRVTSSFIPPGNSGTNFMQSGRGTSPETPRQPDR